MNELLNYRTDPAGANLDDIMEWFEGLDREQVEAVIEFATRKRSVMQPGLADG